MKAHHEHEFEAALGLPEDLPRNEFIVWQGRPEWRQLAIEAFHVRKIAMYFAIMVLWQWVSLMESNTAGMDMLKQLGTSIGLALLALAVLSWSAYWSAQATMYTLTNKRIIMRIGIVLSLTFNLPLKKITACDLQLVNKQTGNIALGIATDSPIGWLNLWPHVRAWRVASPQPTLRCVPQAERLAQTMLQTWRQENPTEQLVSIHTDTRHSNQVLGQA
ncbi:MAG: hypothetical protein RJB47_1090 [Pseudomonadota bacterium]|jgi:hypothetical protein